MAFYTHNKLGIQDVSTSWYCWCWWYFLYLMRGSHDDELTWPLRGKFKTKLLNQISDSEHHSVTVTCDGRCDIYNWIYVGLYKVTLGCQYLEDGCLFIQVAKFKAHFLATCICMSYEVKLVRLHTAYTAIIILWVYVSDLICENPDIMAHNNIFTIKHNNLYKCIL